MALEISDSTELATAEEVLSGADVVDRSEGVADASADVGAEGVAETAESSPSRGNCML